MNDLEKMLREAMQKSAVDRGQNRPQCNNEELISQLREYADILLTNHEFKVGDIVQAKRGINSRYNNFVPRYAVYCNGNYARGYVQIGQVWKFIRQRAE